MTLDGKEPDNRLQTIIKDIVANAAAIPTGGELDSLKERIDSLELLVEEFGQARQLQADLREYVNDLKGEVADIRQYRLIVTICSVVMSVSLFVLLVACMVSRPDWFMALDGSLQVPLIVALGGGSVFLMSLVLRGVYRSRHERNHGDMLPEAVRLALETFQGK